MIKGNIGEGSLLSSKLYFRLPTCSAYNTISWFAIRRSIRVPKKNAQAHTHTHFHQKPLSFLMPTSLACLGLWWGNHNGSSSWLRALDLNVGEFYYWKRTIKNNIYKKNNTKTSSLSQKYNIKWSFTCITCCFFFFFSLSLSRSMQYQYLISIWHFRKNINTKWQLQAWSIKTKFRQTWGQETHESLLSKMMRCQFLQ